MQHPAAARGSWTYTKDDPRLIGSSRSAPWERHRLPQMPEAAPLTARRRSGRRREGQGSCVASRSGPNAGERARRNGCGHEEVRHECSSRGGSTTGTPSSGHRARSPGMRVCVASLAPLRVVSHFVLRWPAHVVADRAAVAPSGRHVSQEKPHPLGGALEPLGQGLGVRGRGLDTTCVYQPG